MSRGGPAKEAALPASAPPHHIQAVERNNTPFSSKHWCLWGRGGRLQKPIVNSFFGEPVASLARKSSPPPPLLLASHSRNHALTHTNPNPLTGGREAFQPIPSKSIGRKGLTGPPKGALRPRRRGFHSTCSSSASLPPTPPLHRHRIRPVPTPCRSSQFPSHPCPQYKRTHRITMAEPWLGGYQNVDASDAYLTPHQREALQHFRAEQGSGFRFQVRQHWERLSGKEQEREGQGGWVGWAIGRGDREGQVGCLLNWAAID